MIGIVANLCGKVEGHAQSCLSLLQKKFVALIRLLSRSKSCVLSHGPETASVHRGLNTPGEGMFAGKSQVLTIVYVLCFQGRGESFHLNMGGCFE